MFNKSKTFAEDAKMNFHAIASIANANVKLGLWDSIALKKLLYLNWG